MARATRGCEARFQEHCFKVGGYGTKENGTKIRLKHIFATMGICAECGSWKPDLDRDNYFGCPRGRHFREVLAKDQNDVAAQERYMEPSNNPKCTRAKRSCYHCGEPVGRTEKHVCVIAMEDRYCAFCCKTGHGCSSCPLKPDFLKFDDELIPRLDENGGRIKSGNEDMRSESSKRWSNSGGWGRSAWRAGSWQESSWRRVEEGATGVKAEAEYERREEEEQKGETSVKDRIKEGMKGLTEGNMLRSLASGQKPMIVKAVRQLKQGEHSDSIFEEAAEARGMRLAQATKLQWRINGDLRTEKELRKQRWHFLEQTAKWLVRGKEEQERYYARADPKHRDLFCRMADRLVKEKKQQCRENPARGRGTEGTRTVATTVERGIAKSSLDQLLAIDEGEAERVVNCSNWDQKRSIKSGLAPGAVRALLESEANGTATVMRLMAEDEMRTEQKRQWRHWQELEDESRRVTTEINRGWMKKQMELVLGVAELRA